MVVDASFVVSALLDAGPVGRWAESVLVSGELVAPHLLLAEVANVLRRAAAAGEVSADIASLAHQDLLSLRIGLFPYSPFASRVWALRHNVTAYDGWYVALAEYLDADVATLDVGLSRVQGLGCGFVLPPR